MFHREGWIERNIELLPFPACLSNGDGTLVAVSRALGDAIRRPAEQSAEEDPGAVHTEQDGLPVAMVRYERTTEDGNRVYLDVSDGPMTWDLWLWELVQPIVRDMAMGIILTDLDLKVRAMNRTAGKMLNTTADAIVGRLLPEAVPELGVVLRPVAHRVAMEGVRNLLFDAEVEGQVQHWLLDSHVVSGFTSAKRTDDKRVVFFLKNLGERFEDQLQRQEKLATVGKIAAGIAHEIRNPLTSIKGFLQIMREKFIRSHMDKEFQYTEVMLAEIDRVNELVGELLLLSRPRDVKLAPTEVEELVTSLAPLISSEALLHDIEFHLCIKPVPKVLADSELLKQVILNLVKNAVEAMEHGGTLTLTTDADREENLVRIDVQDTGPGIPPYAMDRIFDAFFTTKENGTGLGLPICQRIISDLGGMIRVSSKGFGTTFSVLLPAYER